MKGHGDLRLAAWGSLLCAVVALILPWPAVSLVFAAPLALFAPGYAIVAATFARRPLERAPRLVLSLALSLAVLALGALLLNYLGGIHGFSWALLLLLAVVGCCRAAALRREGGPQPSPPRLPRPSGLETALGLGAIAAVAAALVLASTNLPAKSAVGFTELWIVPKAESEGSEAEVGVKSQEQQTTEYDLGVQIGKQQLIRRSFVLEPGEETVVTVGPPVTPARPAAPARRAAPAGSAVPVVATLLLDRDPSFVYRRVKSTLTVPAGGP
jgi:uncharacterized membrane protein